MKIPTTKNHRQLARWINAQRLGYAGDPVAARVESAYTNTDRKLAGTRLRVPTAAACPAAPATPAVEVGGARMMRPSVLAAARWMKARWMNSRAASSSMSKSGHWESRMAVGSRSGSRLGTQTRSWSGLRTQYAPIPPWTKFGRLV